MRMPTSLISGGAVGNQDEKSNTFKVLVVVSESAMQSSYVLLILFNGSPCR